jgi:hypothetical protein
VIGLVAGTLLKAKVPQRAARPVAVLLLVLVAIGAAALAKCSYDRDLIRDHEAGATAAIRTGELKAERAANRGDAAAEAADRAAATALKGEITDAVANHPQAAARPSGPAVNAALGGLRDRQRARGEAGAGPPRRSRPAGDPRADRGLRP